MKKWAYLVFPRRMGAAALLLVAALFLAVTVGSVRAGVMAVSAGGGNINWGLRQKRDGTPPEVAPGADALLKSYNGRYLGDTTAQKVYLTYDLGYEAGYTGQVLDVLKQNGLHAVFFLTGNYLLREGALVQRMIDEGHSLGNHTNKHKLLTKLTAEEVREDILTLEQMCVEMYKVKPAFFRPPEGSFNERVLGIANQMNYTTVLWSGAYVDWNRDKTIGADAVKEKVMAILHPGAVYLFHIASADPPAALPGLLTGFKEKGYTVGEPKELLMGETSMKTTQ